MYMYVKRIGLASNLSGPPLNWHVTNLIRLNDSYGSSLRNKPVKLEPSQHVLIELVRNHLETGCEL